eukprot:765728-Hanusia_phi.AAC.1
MEKPWPDASEGGREARRGRGDVGSYQEVGGLLLAHDEEALDVVEGEGGGFSSSGRLRLDGGFGGEEVHQYC